MNGRIENETKRLNFLLLPTAATMVSSSLATLASFSLSFFLRPSLPFLRRGKIYIKNWNKKRLHAHTLVHRHIGLPTTVEVLSFFGVQSPLATWLPRPKSPIPSDTLHLVVVVCCTTDGRALWRLAPCGSCLLSCIRLWSARNSWRLANRPRGSDRHAAARGPGSGCLKHNTVISGKRSGSGARYLQGGDAGARYAWCTASRAPLALCII